MECRRYQCWRAETTVLRDTSDASYPRKRHVNFAKRRVNGLGSSLRVGPLGVMEAHASGGFIRMDEGATDPGSPLGGVDERTEGVVLVPERSSHLARTNGRWSPVGGGVFIRMDEGATGPAPPSSRWAGGLDERADVVVLVPERALRLARTDGRERRVGGGVFIRMDEGATDPGPPVSRWAGGLDERADVVVLVRERALRLARTDGRERRVGGGVFIRMDEGATDPAPPSSRWAGGLDERADVVVLVRERARLARSDGHIGVVGFVVLPPEN